MMQEQAQAVASPLAAGRAQRRAWLAKVTQGPRLYDVENCAKSTKPVHPAAVITALRKVYPRDGVVLIDSGAHRAFAGHYWTAYEPHTYISATNLGPMGWAIPAAVGVQCARPDCRVAVITGDGCMHMHGMEVQTAARYGLPIIYVVLNNGALGNVWLRAREFGPLPSELTSIPDHDWAGFARALGAEGLTVIDPAQLEETFRRALAANGTVLIDVKTDKNCPTPVYDFNAGAHAWSYHE
jgi:acetolactate synthase-1/2/3 large subunit